MKYIAILTNALFSLALCGMMSSCAESDMSNKAERNAIKAGNSNFEKNKFKEAVSDYDEALEANPNSEAAIYNRAMATLHMEDADSAQLTDARKALSNLAKSGSNAAISERALYNLGNDAVYIGDAIKAAAEQEQGEAAGKMMEESTAQYKQAIENYKEILRRNPTNMRALQNLRIAQLKLPEDQQGGGGDNNNQDQDQQQQQQQDQQQQQQQQQQEKDNNNDNQILQSVQNKENATRKQMPVAPARTRTTDKPW